MNDPKPFDWIAHMRHNDTGNAELNMAVMVLAAVYNTNMQDVAMKKRHEAAMEKVCDKLDVEGRKTAIKGLEAWDNKAPGCMKCDHACDFAIKLIKKYKP